MGSIRSIRLFSLTVFALVAGVAGYVVAKRVNPGMPPRQDELAFYSAAIAENPQDYMTHYRRGTVFQRRRELEKALADYSEAVRLAPQAQSIEALGERSWDSRSRDTHAMSLAVILRTARAEVLQAMNQPDEAIADLTHAITLNARKSDLLFARGLLLAFTGRYDAAVADFDAIIARRSTPQWHFGRGIATYLKGDWQAAAADFQRALAQAPTDGALAMWLVKARLRAGEPIRPEPFAALDRTSSAWPLIDAFMTPRDAAGFVAGVQAGAGNVALQGREKHCETAAFLGEWLTIRARGAGARDMYMRATQVCRPLSVEYAVARAALARLPAQ
jgi:tetratricopeptide (TPR) repeat protein